MIVLDYVVTRVGQNGQSEYYNVEEYYRVRYTNTRMYLLNFERTMEEIFRGENDSISGNSILLGIRSKDVEYQTNESGKVVTFVQEACFASSVTPPRSLTSFSFVISIV